MPVLNHDDELILRMTAEHLLSQGEWPTLRDLQRRAYQELGERPDVRSAAKRLAPHPFLSGYEDLDDTFAPPLSVLAQTEHADEIIAGLLKMIVISREKYLSSSGEVEITDVELRRAASIDATTAAAVRKVAGSVPFLTHGGISSPDGWRVTVSDDVPRWTGVDSREQLLERLKTIEEERSQTYAAMTHAKAETVASQGPAETTGRVVESGPVRMQPTPYFKSIALRLGAGSALVGADASFPPRRSSMPDLSGLYAKNILSLILNITFRAHATTAHPSLAYVAGYVRLVDKAVREYEFARRALAEFVNSSAEQLSPYYRAADHLENCLNSTRRAIRYARRVRRDRVGLVGKTDVPTQLEERRVALFRNATEHADAQVARGELAEGDPVIVLLGEDTFSLGGATESYDWLAALLEKMHTLATRVAGVEAPPGEKG